MIRFFGALAVLTLLAGLGSICFPVYSHAAEPSSDGPLDPSLPSDPPVVRALLAKAILEAGQMLAKNGISVGQYASYRSAPRSKRKRNLYDELADDLRNYRQYLLAKHEELGALDPISLVAKADAIGWETKQLAARYLGLRETAKNRQKLRQLEKKIGFNEAEIELIDALDRQVPSDGRARIIAEAETKLFNEHDVGRKITALGTLGLIAGVFMSQSDPQLAACIAGAGLLGMAVHEIRMVSLRRTLGKHVKTMRRLEERYGTELVSAREVFNRQLEERRRLGFHGLLERLRSLFCGPRRYRIADPPKRVASATSRISDDEIAALEAAEAELRENAKRRCSLME